MLTLCLPAERRFREREEVEGEDDDGRRWRGEGEMDGGTEKIRKVVRDQ